VKIRRRLKQVIQVPATPLESTAAIEELRQLDDKALDIEMANATTTEGWLRSTAAALSATPKGSGGLVELVEHAAAYTRCAREVMLLLVAQRVDERKGEKKPGGYL
jgi:hypothetical protein